MSDPFIFELDTTSRKISCPGCGKKTFVQYVYVDSKDPVSPEKYGRCDRENNCGYHTHPAQDKEFTPEDKPVKAPVEEKIVQIFPDESVVQNITKRTKTCVSPFHHYCKQLGIPFDHLLKWGVYSSGDKGDVTAFLFIDKENKVSNIKYFKYQQNGHRDKQYKAHSLKQPASPSTPQKGIITQKKYLLGLFGEHLLDNSKKRTVCVVESEKTAVIASYFYPKYDWVSCMSNNGLTADRIQKLLNRKVIWVCDNDKAGRQNTSIKRASVQLMDFHIADLFPEKEYTEGYDLADAIQDGLRPEIHITESFEKNDKPEIISNEAEELYTLPEGVTFEMVKDQIQNYGFFIHKNKIFIIKMQKGGGGYFSNQVSNFMISPLGLIISKFYPRRLISIKNVSGLEKVLEVPTKAFASNTDFTVFVESEGNFQWNGTVTDLKKIRSPLYDEMKEFEEVDSLGWHKEGYFIFANGVFNGKFHPINEFGFVELGKKNFYIEPLSCIHKESSEDWEDEKKFIYKTRTDVSLNTWSELFVKVHKDNGRIALAWFITSLFRDFIYNRFKFFPHLFLFGPPGTGKSQVGWSIRAMGFSGIKKPFNLSGGTQVAFYREFSHFTNFPCWFDEYDNSIDYQRVQSLKAAYDGAGHKKSVKDSDKRTKTVPVNSACMISGQQLPIADNALFKRVILTQFHQTEFNDQEKQLFTKLQDMEEGGLSCLTTEILNHRKIIESQYLNEFEKILSEMMADIPARVNVEDRILRNMCICLTTIKLLENKLDLPIDYLSMKSVAVHNISEQMSLINNANETNTFWDMVSYLIDQGLIMEEVDYKFRALRQITVYSNGETVQRDLGGTTTVLYLRTSKVIPLYREHFKRQNNSSASAMDKGSLIHYLQHQKYYLNPVKVTKFNTGQYDASGSPKQTTTSAYVFNYDIMETMGIELKRGDSDHNINSKHENEDTAETDNGKQMSIENDKYQKPPF